MELSGRQRVVLAIIAAIIMLLDNITTWLAISSGAVEKNPIVAFFLKDQATFILFTVIKVDVAMFLTLAYVKTKKELLLWILVMLVFVRAIYINIMNYISGGIRG